MAVSCRSLDKIYLRQPKPSDLSSYNKWWQESIANYMDFGKPGATPSNQTISDFETSVQNRYTPGWFTIIFMDEYFGEFPVGYVRYRGVEWDKRRTEIALRIGQEHWGQSIGQAAIGELLAYLFFEKGLEEAWLKVASFNQRAVRLYEKCGFIETRREMDQEHPELTWIIMSIHKTKFARISH